MSVHAQQPAPLGGRLFAAVFRGEALPAADLPSAGISPAQRARLLTYITRRSATTAAAAAGSGVAARRAVLAREVVALLDTPGIEQAASALAGDAPLADPKDPNAASHLAEVAWAETWLRENRGSPATPYVYAHIAVAARTAFEASGSDKDARERLAKKYRTMLDRVRASTDPLFTLLANDIDGVPSFGAGMPHPREYLPDT